jgi:hypothetical protein
MTKGEIAVKHLSDVDHRKQLRRAVVASALGTTIEWYDVFIYGIVTGLVFAKLTFRNPTHSPARCRRMPSSSSALSPAQSGPPSSDITEIASSARRH